jgi:putative oxidoreductase
MNGSTRVDRRPSSRIGDGISTTASRSPDRPARGWMLSRRRLEAMDNSVRERLAPLGPRLLQFSLGIVFVWFGMLKVVNASAVGGLVVATVPFADAAWFVPTLGVLEVAMGLAFVSGRFLRLVLPVFALHMAGTFLVLPMLPDVAFEQDNPLMLSVVGEFVVKNLVLLSAGIVVSSGANRPRPRNQTPRQLSRRVDRRKERAMTGRRMIVWILTVTALSLAASACGSDDQVDVSALAEGSAIVVRDYEFEPAAATVKVGDTVTWVWEGTAPHNVVGEGFKSADQSSGTFRHTFDRPGTYEYGCTIHPGMDGSVIVTEASK